MKVYAKKGDTTQTVLYDGVTKKAAGLGVDHILMKSERPTANHVAAVGGIWVLLEVEGPEKATGK